MNSYYRLVDYPQREMHAIISNAWASTSQPVVCKVHSGRLQNVSKYYNHHNLQDSTVMMLYYCYQNKRKPEMLKSEMVELAIVNTLASGWFWRFS